jgi:hypothetical protein
MFNFEDILNIVCVTDIFVKFVTYVQKSSFFYKIRQMIFIIYRILWSFIYFWGFYEVNQFVYFD